jgi:hypothetical protein
MKGGLTVLFIWSSGLFGLSRLSGFWVELN